MSKKFSFNPEENVHGISPLGGNSVEGTGTGLAEVRDTTVQGVPLVYDHRAGNYISEQAVDELDDRDISLARAEEFQREETFMDQAGFGRTPTPVSSWDV
jgi:hypothetical protein